MLANLVSPRWVEIFIDSFWKILLPGLKITIPLTAVSFVFALIIAVVVALIQFAEVPVLKQLARFYVWVIRGTPILVQLFVVFYGLPGAGILIDPIPAALIVFSINEGAYASVLEPESPISTSSPFLEPSFSITEPRYSSGTSI